MDERALKRKFAKPLRTLREASKNALLTFLEIEEALAEAQLAAYPEVIVPADAPGSHSVYDPGPPRRLQLVMVGQAPSLNRNYKGAIPLDRKVKLTLRGYWERQIRSALARCRGPTLEPFSEAYVVAVFRFADRRWRDVDNYWDKSIFDTLRRAGVVEADSIRVLKGLSSFIAGGAGAQTELVLTDSAELYCDLVRAAVSGGYFNGDREPETVEDPQPEIPISGSEEDDLPF